MSVQLAAQVWNLVSDALPYDDKSAFAEELVAILIDHGYDTDDIRHEFYGDREIANALSLHGEDAEEDLDTYGEDDSDDEW